MRRPLVGVVIVCLLCGCSFPRAQFVVTDPDPSIKIPAIHSAVSSKDLSAAKQMVADLESDDPAVRFYAVEGLQRLTGEDFGFRYWKDVDEQQPAVTKWKQWLKDSGVADVELEPPTTRPL